MNLKIKTILKTHTLRQSLLTTSSTVITGALGLVFYVFAARTLGPAAFGILSVTIAMITLMADISNLGSDTTVIRFVGKYLQNNRENALRALKLALEIKLLAWASIVLLGWVLVPFITNNLLKKPELELPFYLGLMGIGTASLFSFTSSALQAFQKFWWWAGLNIASNGIRLIIVFVLFLQASLNTTNTLITYISIPLLVFLTGLFVLPRFITIAGESKILKEFFHYNKWMGLFIVVAAISSRIDTFLITRFLDTASLGIYSAANQISSVIPQLVFAIATVVAPKLASYRNNKEVLVYLKKLQLFVSTLALLGLVVLIGVVYLLPSVFGVEYVESRGPLIFLIIGQLIFLISLPVHQAIFYYFARPDIFLWLSLVHLTLMLAIGPVLITQFGIVGAAIAVALGSLINFLIPAFWVILKLRNGKFL